MAPSGEEANESLLAMEQEILESRKNYNHIPNLIQQMEELSGTSEGMEVAESLCRVFVRLFAQGSLTLKKTLSEKDTVVVRWLREQFSTFKQTLRVGFSRHSETLLPSLSTRMRAIRAEARHSNAGGLYLRPFEDDLQHFVLDLLQSDDDDSEEAIEEVANEFLFKYEDVRYYVFKHIKTIILQSDPEDQAEVFTRLINIMQLADQVPEDQDDLEDFWGNTPEKKHDLLSVRKHKQVAQEAWLALLNIAESKSQRKRVLSIFEASVVPWFNQPERLADFLTNAYNSGGSMALLALSSIFSLIKSRNLDYPSFYQKLYSLIDRDLLHSKNRSNFFRQLDIFMASTHLPAALVASFIKRLARFSLYAPPGAIVAVVPWIYNQFRRHPACTFMMHRVIRDPELKNKIEQEGFEDPFDPEEMDPMKTGAIDSSLWEVVQLQDHYHPNVATICKIISQQFTKNSYNMEDVLDHSYASLLEAELSQDIKKAPPVEFQIQKKGFLQAGSGAEPDTLLTRLFDFSG